MLRRNLYLMGRRSACRCMPDILGHLQVCSICAGMDEAADPSVERGHVASTCQATVANHIEAAFIISRP